MPVSPLAGMDGDVRDVGLAGDEHQPAVADDRAAAPGDDVVAAAGPRLVQLVVEHLRRPRPRVRVAFDLHHVADVADLHRDRS